MNAARARDCVSAEHRIDIIRIWAHSVRFCSSHSFGLVGYCSVEPPPPLLPLRHPHFIPPFPIAARRFSALANRSQIGAPYRRSLALPRAIRDHSLPQSQRSAQQTVGPRCAKAERASHIKASPTFNRTHRVCVRVRHTSAPQTRTTHTHTRAHTHVRAAFNTNVEVPSRSNSFCR